MPLPGDFGMDRLVKDVLALLDLVGSASAVFLGQSMGGNLSQEIVFRHPELASALVLIDCTDNFQRLSALEQVSPASAGPHFALYPFKTLKRQSAEASAYTPRARERLAAMMDRVAEWRDSTALRSRLCAVVAMFPTWIGQTK